MKKNVNYSRRGFLKKNVAIVSGLIVAGTGLSRWLNGKQGEKKRQVSEYSASYYKKLAG